MTDKPKVIATGLTGLVGSRIAELLDNRFEFINCSPATGVDILDFDSLKTLFKKHPDAGVVIHLAAFTDTAGAWEQRGDRNGKCYQLNVEGTKNIVELCDRYQKYLVYFSTDFVFSGKKDGVYTEEDHPDPIEWYGYTKYLGEVAVQKSGSPAAITRIAFPFRTSFEPKKDLVRRIVEGLKNDSLYPMFTDQITTPTFIDDIAEAMITFINKKPGGIFHLVGSSHHSPYEMAVLVAEVFGIDPKKVKRGSLLEYQKKLPLGSRPWQKNLALDNQKITGMRIKMRTLKEALLEIKKQMSS